MWTPSLHVLNKKWTQGCVINQNILHFLDINFVSSRSIKQANVDQSYHVLNKNSFSRAIDQES